MTNPTPTLGFGLKTAIPEGVTAVWGARLIVGQDGYVDFVSDRQDLGSTSPEDRAALIAWLNGGGIGRIIDHVKADLSARIIDTRKAEDVILINDGEATAIANSNASAGYVYVTAYLNAHVPVGA